MEAITKIVKSALLAIFAPVLAPILAPVLASGANVSVMQCQYGDNNVKVEAVTNNIIKVTLSRAGYPEMKSRMVELPNPDVTIFANPKADAQVLVTATGIIASLDKTTGDVVISAGADKVVSSALPQALGKEQKLVLNTMGEASWYGAGERGHSINLRGDTLVMYNRQNYGYTKGDPRINQMNITMPLVLSSKGYALLFDDFAAASLYLGNDGEVAYTTESPNAISYYFINGASTLADVVRETSALTGRQPLPPLWSLGYITSKYGYHNEKETLGAIDSLKTRGYPVDGIVLDLYWYGKEQDMGALSWAPEQWPDPQRMLKQLKDENVNLIAISQPYVLRNGRGLDNYNELSAKGMLVLDSLRQGPQEVEIWVGEGGMLDVSNPDTKKWLSDTYRDLTEMGVAGWWGDLGEPEVHPQTGEHANGLNARLYHNQYGNDWSEIVSNMFAENYPDQRFISMMRGGTTGLQKYSVFPWSTDVSRSWEGMQPQITIMLNSGLSGLGYMGHDVGGFAVDKENPEDAELYVRWLQLGLFSPMLRTHAQFKAEPYHYPQYADIILPLIKERYRWIPYNYTLAYENAAFGYPLVRPLNFYESGSNAYDDIDDEYLWGSEVLVAPVMEQGATSRKVVFPQGEWVDFNNPSQRYQGGTSTEYDAPLSVLPLFVKAGAFIPLADYKMTSTAQYDPSKLTVEYFASQHPTSYTMYDDNRVSQSALSSGNYRLVEFSGQTSADGEVKINIVSQGTYPGAPKEIKMQLCVNSLEKAPTQALVNGKKTKVAYKGGKAILNLSFTPGTPTTIIIK